MKCHNDTGKCAHRPKCEHACSLRVQPVIDALAASGEEARPLLARIGSSIGYGNAQHILGQLWDEMLSESYGVLPGRGSMGITANEREAYRHGWEACMTKWADHMKRMAKAMK